VEPLPEEVIAAIAGADIAVVSTVQTFLDAGVDAATLLGNATRLHAAGVRLAYGTDLGNTGTRPGVDPRELGALSRAGLGPLGALRAATDVAAGLHAMTGASGLLAREQPADVVVLRGDPVADPRHWRAPLAVAVAGRIVAGAAARRP
jgi:imidazolonepropionase-like amidohydrolase